MPETAATASQWSLIRRWLNTLKQIPELDVVWLEGSLAVGRGNPSSDIDIRFGIADSAYEQLWEVNRTPLLEGLGEYLLLETRFVRALTVDGLIVEASAHKTSQLNTLERYEWEILWNQLPNNQPNFKKLPERSPAETWPMREELTVDVVRYLTNTYLLLLANSPAPLYNGEFHSARFQLDDMRTELIKVMYQRLGLAYAKRYKHFSEIFPAEWLADLDRTYMQSEADPLDRIAMAEAYIHLFDVLGKHLQALSNKAGGGFEPEWYARLHHQVSEKFHQTFTS